MQGIISLFYNGPKPLEQTYKQSTRPRALLELNKWIQS